MSWILDRKLLYQYIDHHCYWIHLWWRYSTHDDCYPNLSLHPIFLPKVSLRTLFQSSESVQRCPQWKNDHYYESHTHHSLSHQYIHVWSRWHICNGEKYFYDVGNFYFYLRLLQWGFLSFLPFLQFFPDLHLHGIILFLLSSLSLFSFLKIF